MAFDSLQDQLQNLTLLPECLPFSLTDNVEQHNKFEDIPRFLFRIFTPNSQGTTDIVWTKSMEARYATAASRVYIFLETKTKEPACCIGISNGGKALTIIWHHGQFIVICASVYLFQLHANVRDGSAFAVSVCIISSIT
ncbi:hypothetical protein F5884DRAFT_805189, partial [Xylogone sp. PMI_703]